MPRLIAPIENFATATINETLHGRSERWKAVAGWSAYEVSDLGRVRRCLPGKGTWVGRILKPNRHRQGYLLYRLMQDGLQRDVLGHVLIAEAFLGGIPEGLECNHGNGIKEDNRVENIEIVTHSENMRHADRTGLRNPRKPNPKNRGSNNGMARLTEPDVSVIKRCILNGELISRLAERFNVGVQAIAKIRDGKRWTHVSTA